MTWLKTPFSNPSLIFNKMKPINYITLVDNFYQNILDKPFSKRHSREKPRTLKKPLFSQHY